MTGTIMPTNSKKGFTLIELIVVMAMFLLIISGAIAIFMSIFSHQKRILSEQQLISQISYAQEYMSKALRMAKRSSAIEEIDCLDGNPDYSYLLTRYDTVSHKFKGIKFLNQSDFDFNNNPSCQEFYVAEADGNVILWEIKNGSEPVALTSKDLLINFDDFFFAVNGKEDYSDCIDSGACGASGADRVQPKATMVLNVKIPGADEPERIFQTTVSQRNLNAQ